MLRLGNKICMQCLSNLTFRTIPNVVKVKNVVPQIQIVRDIGFFSKSNAEMLWKGVTTVSNAGKKRGRGRGGDVKGKRDLNVGQKAGYGKDRVIWPGLTCPVLQGNTLVSIQKVPNQDTKDKFVVDRKVLKRRLAKVHPLERGWTGRSFGGRHLGCPDPIGDETFESFDSIIIEHKLNVRMTSIFGRKRNFSSLVLVGNKNGLIGLGAAKGLDGKVTLKQAKNKAVKRLISIDLIDKHTVNHDFYSQYSKTKLFVSKAPEGYGLKCQRVIKACCELLGIKNLYAKIEGAINYKNIVRAFLIGLLQQKTYQQIADDKKLHLVEFKKEMQNIPEVLASPEKCLTPYEARKDMVNFEEYILGNRLRFRKKRKVPFYMKLPSWQTHLKRTIYRRNHFNVKINMLAHQGDIRSYLGDYYPECNRCMKNLAK